MKSLLYLMGYKARIKLRKNVHHFIELFEKSRRNQQFSVQTILLSFLIILFGSNACKLSIIQKPSPAEFSNRELLRRNEVAKQHMVMVAQT